MSLITRKLILTGARRGMTGTLGRQFKAVNGVITLLASAPDVEALTLFIGRMYQAFPEGSAELEAANGKRHLHENPVKDSKHHLQGGVQPSEPGAPKKAAVNDQGTDEAAQGSTGVLPNGDGHRHSRLHRIEEALKQLDITNDQHWTADGRPAVAAVESIIGEPVTRAEIAAASPNFNREGK